MLNSGYTLIECIFVLSILSLCLVFTSFNSDSIMLSLQAQRIENILYLAKAQAMNDYESKIIEIRSNSISVDDNITYFQHGVVCENYVFSINAKGNSSMANSITCYLNEESVDIVMHLGNSDFEIQ